MQVKVYSDFSGWTTLTINDDNLANGFHNIDIYGNYVYIDFLNEGDSEIKLTLAAVHIYSQRHHDATKMILFGDSINPQEIYPQDNTYSHGLPCLLNFGYSTSYSDGSFT